MKFFIVFGWEPEEETDEEWAQNIVDKSFEAIAKDWDRYGMGWFVRLLPYR